jgi:hypothetical protein
MTGKLLCESPPFSLAEKQRMLMVRRIAYNDIISLRRWPSRAEVERCSVEITSSGCGITEIAVSRSGRWAVSQRSSGQGEWGYDLFSTSPMQRVAGIAERCGYIAETPQFSADESKLAGGYGNDWLGSWWTDSEDDWSEPARGGLLEIGFVFIHDLLDHCVSLHELVVQVPRGWVPDDPEEAMWSSPTNIVPTEHGFSMTLPGGVPFSVEAPGERVQLPLVHPSGGKLLLVCLLVVDVCGSGVSARI